MELYVKNSDLETVGIIDVYTSIIWTKRYYTAGDFELYLPASADALNVLRAGNYVTRMDDDRVMIIESIQITTDAEAGNYLIVSGRSLESILKRRIIWGQTVINGQFAPMIYRLIRENCIETAAERVIPRLSINEDLTFADAIQAQYTGDNLYDVVCELCRVHGYGWKITLQDDSFVFSLYNGMDHSYNQTENPFVIFSPEFDNLLNSDYRFNTSNFANAALIAGEGEGVDRKLENIGTASGLDRYEIFVDAKDISSNSDSETPISDAEYKQLLQTRGFEKLEEYAVTESFSGESEPTTYCYKEHWNIGDIVQVENEFRIGAAARITEIIEADDENGHSVIPTWEHAEAEHMYTVLRDSAGYILRDSEGRILTVKE